MTALPETMTCFVVAQADDRIDARLESRPLGDLSPGDVTVRVEFSALNYKDALAAQGHPGVAKKLPHVPGIDAAGTVAESRSADFRPGDQVIVTGYELGAGRWGGWAEFIRVPADWVIPLPHGLTLREAAVYGTAGFTAAEAVEALEQHGITPERGEIVVTGASGGVGSLAVRLLSQLGYAVVAVSGKPEQQDWLKSLGAREVVPRESVDDKSPRPLLPARWAGAVDTVGGNTLATILRSTQNSGCVAACGLVGGTDLPLTVYPFILRGVTLAGIDSAWCPRARRVEIWNKLAGPWKPARLTEQVTEITLSDVAGYVERMLRGQVAGRVILRIARDDGNIGNATG